MKHIENNIKITNTENRYCIGNNDKIIKKLKIKKLDVNKKITNYFNTKT